MCFLSSSKQWFVFKEKRYFIGNKFSFNWIFFSKKNTLLYVNLKQLEWQVILLCYFVITCRKFSRLPQIIIDKYIFCVSRLYLFYLKYVSLTLYFLCRLPSQWRLIQSLIRPPYKDGWSPWDWMIFFSTLALVSLEKMNRHLQYQFLVCYDILNVEPCLLHFHCKE